MPRPSSAEDARPVSGAPRIPSGGPGRRTASTAGPPTPSNCTETESQPLTAARKSGAAAARAATVAPPPAEEEEEEEEEELPLAPARASASAKQAAQAASALSLSTETPSISSSAEEGRQLTDASGGSSLSVALNLISPRGRTGCILVSFEAESAEEEEALPPPSPVIAAPLFRPLSASTSPRTNCGAALAGGSDVDGLTARKRPVACSETQSRSMSAVETGAPGAQRQARRSSSAEKGKGGGGGGRGGGAAASASSPSRSLSFAPAFASPLDELGSPRSLTSGACQSCGPRFCGRSSPTRSLQSSRTATSGLTRAMSSEI